MKSSPLAARAKERAPRRLNNAFDRRAATTTRLAGPVINPQTLRVKIMRDRCAAVIEKSGAIRFPAEFERHGAAEGNRFAEHVANRGLEPLGFGASEPVRAFAWRDGRRVQRLARVNISDPGHQRLVEQLDFDRLRRTVERRVKRVRIERTIERLGAEARQRSGVEREAAEVARVLEDEAGAAASDSD